MKTLFLLRHAKAARGDGALPDAERPLAERGRGDAQRLAAFLRRRRLRPAAVLCSPSLRTRQTLHLIGPALSDAPVALEPRLYEATAGTLLSLLAATPAEVASVLLVGHNPGLADLALLLAGSGKSGPLGRMAEKYPTGALAILTHPGAWTALAPGCCKLEEFVRPADLA